MEGDKIGAAVKIGFEFLLKEKVGGRGNECLTNELKIKALK